MVVVAPAQAKPVLAMLLNPCGLIAALPIRPLHLEEELARRITPHQVQHAIEDSVRCLEPFRVLGEQPRTRQQKFARLDDGFEFAGLERGRNETTIGPAFNGFEPGAVFFGYENAPIPRIRFSLRLARQMVAGNKIGQRLWPECNRRGILIFAPAEQNAGEGGPGMLVDGLIADCLRLLITDEAAGLQSRSPPPH